MQQSKYMKQNSNEQNIFKKINWQEAKQLAVNKRDRAKVGLKPSVSTYQVQHSYCQATLPVSISGSTRCFYLLNILES